MCRLIGFKLMGWCWMAETMGLPILAFLDINLVLLLYTYGCFGIKISRARFGGGYMGLSTIFKRNNPICVHSPFLSYLNE